MSTKEISIVFYQRDYLVAKWRGVFDAADIDGMVQSLYSELVPLGFHLTCREDTGLRMAIKGYGDLLNSIRIRCPDHGVGNMCLGHIIGSSKNLDLAEDIRRGVNRVAFAPETVEPEGSDKIVCHNCGCGC